MNTRGNESLKPTKERSSQTIWHEDIYWLESLCLSLACVCAKLLQSCLTLCNPMDCSLPRLLCPWDSPDKNTGVGSHSLLQGIFLTQESDLGLLHCRQILYCLSPKGSPFLFFIHSLISETIKDWKKGEGERKYLPTLRYPHAIKFTFSKSVQFSSF